MDRLTYARTFDEEQGVLKDITIEEFQDGQLARIQKTPLAQWTNGTWIMEGGSITDLTGAAGVSRSMTFDKQVLPIAATPKAITLDQKTPEQMTIGELKTYINILQGQYMVPDTGAVAASPAGEAAAAVSTDTSTQGTITGTEVRMRDGAGTASAILGYFAKGEGVQVLKSDMVDGAKWYNVRRNDGTSGWVSADYCALSGEAKVEVEAAAPVEKSGKIVGTDVRMRREPSLDADILDYFTNGESVSILDTAGSGNSSWTKVKRANGTIGWVFSAYCKEE